MPNGMAGASWLDPFGYEQDREFDPVARQQRIKNAAKRPIKRLRTVNVPEVIGATAVEGIRVFAVDRELMLLKPLSFGGTYFPGEDYHAHCPHAHDRHRTSALGRLGGRLLFSPHNAIRVVPEYPIHRYTNKPVAECTCGVWACKSRSTLQRAVPAWNDGSLLVSARVLLWGTIIEHEIGWRGEWARIIPQSISKYPRWSERRAVARTNRWDKHIAHLREKYGAPYSI